MIKKGRKIIVFLVLMILIVGFMDNRANASDGWDQKITTTDIKDEKIKSGMNIIIGVFQAVAIGVAVSSLILTGIKIMQASPEGKANVKKHLIPYVVGAVLLFATTGVLQIIKDFTEEIVPQSDSITEKTE